VKIIIDPYRGGSDIGKNISGQYEKNILLNISKYMNTEFIKNGIESELVRSNDISLSDDERNTIINEIKTSDDIIIQNRLSEDNNFNIIYPLRNSDQLVSLISSNLKLNNINVNKYYQRRLPTDTTLDYYSVLRNTKPNFALIIEYNDSSNYIPIVNVIVETIVKYLGNKNTYTVKKGDSLYQIAKKYNMSVEELKMINNLTSNNLSIGQVLKIPQMKDNVDGDTYIVKKGDSLYQIAKKYNMSVEELKRINNLTSNNLSIGQVLKIPQIKDNGDGNTYIVKKGDSLYQIAKKYNTSVEELKRINNLTSNNLSIGQVLEIPQIKDNGDGNTYIVKKGDSLYQIAKKYNMSVEELKRINNLTSNNLSIGQVLEIYK